MSTINTNAASINAQRNLSASQGSLSTSMQRLSSGLRVNSAKDDAAGLAISERMNSQVKGMNVAIRNANDGISLAQTAEGALGKVGDMLQRVRELAVQSANATNSDTDRASLQAEANQLKLEIQRVAEQTKFNGTALLDGSFSAKAFQVGANQGETISIESIANTQMSALGSWTSVARDATTTGVAITPPAGTTTTTPGTAVLTAASLAAPVETSGVFDYAASTISLDGGTTTINVAAATGATEDAARADYLDKLATALGSSGLTISTTTPGQLSFSNTTANPIVITDSDSPLDGNITVAGQTTTTTSTEFSALTGSAFTINGTNIEVPAAATSAGRINDLVSAINGTANLGVTASVKDGVLKLTSAANITIAGSGDVLAQTGLTAGTSSITPAAAQTGFADLNIDTVDGANDAILAMDAALTAVNNSRGDLGAMQSRFENAIGTLQVTSENLASARGRIVDADFAKETSNLSRAQILQQAGTAMVAQANQLPQGVLSLLR